MTRSAGGSLDRTRHPRAPLEMEGGTTLVNVGKPGVEQVRVVGAPGVTHIKYRVK
jgi:hypothetical protein